MKTFKIPQRTGGFFIGYLWHFIVHIAFVLILHNIIYSFETKNELAFLAGTEQLKVILQG